MGEYGAAVHALRRYLEARPRSADMNLNLGTLLMLQQRFEEAIPSLTLAAELDPTSDSARNNLGSALTTLGRLKDALPYFRYWETVREGGDPTEANTLLGAPTTTLEQWCQQEKARLAG